MGMITCKACGRDYNADVLRSCPACHAPMGTNPTADSDLARAIDPTTSQDDLGKLAFHSDPGVVAAVLANPNTPQWAKKRLGGATGSGTASAAPGQPTVVGIRSGDAAQSGTVSGPVQDAARNASSAAGTLVTVATILLVLGALGGLLLIINGFANPVCRSGAIDCYSSDRSPNFTMIGLGVSGILMWVFIWAIANAISERLRLAAAVAMSGR